MVLNSAIHGAECATAQLANLAAPHALNLPLLFILFVLVLPLETIAAEYKDAKDEWLDEEACEDVGISKNDISTSH